MAIMLGQKRQRPKTVLFARLKTQKHNRNREKLFNFRDLVFLKGSTFHLKDKKAISGLKAATECFS